jgi:hypothetical protein
MYVCMYVCIAIALSFMIETTFLYVCMYVCNESHRYEEWKSKGVSIVPVISRPNLPESGDWTGRTGMA